MKIVSVVVSAMLILLLVAAFVKRENVTETVQDNGVNQSVSPDLSGVLTTHGENHQAESEQEQSIVSQDNEFDLPFDDDKSWCQTNDEYGVGGETVAYNDSNEWAVERGDILLPETDSDFVQHNESLLAPYLEAPISALLQNAENDDNYALLTLLQREDTSRDTKANAAHKLLVLGNTSLAPAYLVIREMMMANYVYKENGAINETVEQHLINSLAYIDYGLERRDVTALRSYLTVLKQHERGTYELDPESVLAEHHFPLIAKRKIALVESINTKRAEKYLEPIGSQSFPAVAVRDFETSLAIEYANFGELIAGSRNLHRISYNFENKSDCLTKAIANFR